MNWDELARKVLAAWRATAEARPDLFANNVSEDGVRGQLVKHLDSAMAGSGFEIDVNFNVMNYANEVRGIKRIVPRKDETGRVLIDLVVHRPGFDDIESNLLAIELKKETNPDWPSDVAKLLELTHIPRGLRPFQYQYGLLIRYRQSSLFAHAVLCRNGVEVEIDPLTLSENSLP